MSKTPEIPIAIASVVSEGGGGGAEEMAHATMAPTIGPRGETSQTQIRELEKLGLPAGLADVVAKSSEACAVRFWIVDNSGSMGTQDGNVCKSGKMVSCSRWAELGESLSWHGRCAAVLGARTEFRLLNQPRNGASQRVVVGDGDDESSIGQLDMVIRSSPTGKTPLCVALNEVVAELTALAPALRAANRIATVIVASDGEASDGDVARAMAPLANLPCTAVIRLCTDEVQVVDYWNNIDADLELEMDVFDDVAGEGKEVHEHNPWVAYGEALHRVREFGAAPKLFDLLDERRFYPSEGRELVEMILGVTMRTDPGVDAKKFMSELQELMNRSAQVFDPSTGRTVPWIDVKAFGKTVLKGNSGPCSLM